MFKIVNTAALLATTAMTMPAAFENKAGWKMDGDKLALDDKGNPIYLDSNGNEQSVDQNTISRLNGEAKQHREAKEAAEAALKKFAGIDDPEAAKKAIETVSKLDQKQLIDAGEVDKVKASISEQFTGQLNEAKATNEKLQSDYNELLKGRALDRSQFIGERVAVPRDMFEATFGRNFKVEDGKVVPYGPDGNKIYSKKRMGEVADVDEALEILVEQHPNKDAILKATGAGGSGNNGGGGARGGGRTMRRAEFDALDGTAKAEAAGLMGKGELTVTD